MRIRRIVTSSLLVMLMATTVFASNYKVKVGGAPVNTSIKVIDGRSMISLRDIGEALGLGVNYDKENNRVLLEKNYQNMNNLLILDLGTGLAYSQVWGDGDLYRYEKDNLRLEVAPKRIDGKIYVPLRFVCDIFASPINVTGDHIVIGDIFTSGLKTARLDQAQKQLNSSQAVLAYDKYIRDIDKILVMNDLAEDYVDGLAEDAYYYLGSEGYYMSVDIMDTYSYLTGMNMETQIGHKIKKSFEKLFLNLGNQYSDLGNYDVPTSTRVNNAIKIYNPKKYHRYSNHG